MAGRRTRYLYLCPGKGEGGFAARKYVGKGWNGRTGFATPENSVSPLPHSQGHLLQTCGYSAAELDSWRPGNGLTDDDPTGYLSDHQQPAAGLRVGQ